MATLDDHIAEALRQCEQAGELRAAKSYGKPLDFGDGWDDTPPELRMPFKILKDAGYVPHEVTMLRELQAMRAQLAVCPLGEQRDALARRASDMQQLLALRLEKLRATGSL